MEQDMARATIQAQLTHLTSQLTQYAEMTTMPSVPRFDVPYGQGFQLHQHSQFTANGDAWGYQGYDQSTNNMFSNAYNLDWRDYSDYRWEEPQQGEYWQQEEEFYSRSMQPPQAPFQPQQQQAQSKSLEDLIASLANSTISHQQKTDKAIESLERQMSQLASLMEQQHQSGRLLSQIVVNPNAEQMNAVTLRNEKDIVEALPEVQSDTQILGATKQVPDCVELFKEPCTPRQMIQEEKEAGEYVECIKEDVLEETEATEVETDDKGQATTIIVNLAKFKVPETFKNVVFVLEFVSMKTSKPSSPILILFYTNMFLILMIQAPTLEFTPLPDHFKYHRPFKDKSMQLNNEGRPRNHPQPDLHS